MPKFYSRSEAKVSSPDYQNEPLLESPKLLEAPHPQTGPEQAFYPEQGNGNIVKTLLTWRAPARPFRKKNRSYYTTVATLILLISMIAVLAGEILLIGALFAIGFVIYVLNFVPPEDIDYKISTQGITIGDHFYHWDEMDSFWFGEKEGHKMLSVLTNLHFPGMLMLVLDGVDEEEVKRVCANYLPFHEIAPKSIMDKWSESLQKHFPLENPQH